MSERPYARVYHEVMSDPKFDGIREDVRLFGSWTLCLVVADMAYPAPAFVPPTVPRSAVRRLIECGLLDELPGHRFRVHGLEKERNARADAARNAAAMRWHSGGNADPMPSRAEHSQAEPSRDNARDPEWLKAWWACGKFQPPTEKQQALIDVYLRTFDVTGDERLAGVFLRGSGDPIGALKDDLAAFRAARRAEAAASEPPRPQPKRQRARGLTGINAELAALLREQDAKREGAA